MAVVLACALLTDRMQLRSVGLCTPSPVRMGGAVDASAVSLRRVTGLSYMARLLASAGVLGSGESGCFWSV